MVKIAAGCSMQRARRASGLLLAGAALLSALPARAWQIEDPIHAPCHERISQAALSRTGYAREPDELSGDDSDLYENVDFDASAYDANLYALSLVVGVRWGDTHGGPSFSFSSMAAAANAPDDQRAHCLRRDDQDGAEGEAGAVQDCRAWIESLYWLALGSLDEDGNVAPERRASVTVATEYQGTVYYPLSELYFYAGRALHAVQDSFTHTFRSEDGHRIRHVLNWSDQVSCTLDEARDGHGHERVLDDCEDGDPSEAERFELATAASSELLSALTTPGSRAERAERIASFLETWISYEPGCTLASGYCENAVYDWLRKSDRSDRDICDGPLGCELAGPARPGGAGRGLLLGGTVAMAALALGRRRRRLGAALGASLLLIPAISKADEEPELPAPKARGVGGPRLEARGSLSVDSPAYAFGVAGLYGFRRADVGIFAELNPWYSIERRRMSLGATNFGVLGHYLHPLRRDLLLRFGLGLGASVLNTDMLGVEAGNLGVYLNVRVMGLIWEFTDGVALTADPLDLALPAPALVGWPILHTQHRFSLGLQFSL